jgi:hypothetical protein
VGAVFILFACALSFGSIGPACAAPDAKPVTAATAKTAPPLPPGSAATIKQAQGTGGILLGALVTGGIFAAILLLVDGEDTGPFTTATGTSE